MMIERTKEEIDATRNKAQDDGSSRWPGMTYEQGVEAALAWIMGDTDLNPMDDA